MEQGKKGKNCQDNHRTILTLEELKLVKVKVMKIFGITLDNHLTVHQQINKIHKIVSSSLKRLQPIRAAISPQEADRIYNVIIRPVLLYCYPVHINLGDKGQI